MARCKPEANPLSKNEFRTLLAQWLQDGSPRTRLEIARRAVAKCIEAEMAVLGSKSYMIGGQSLTRENLDSIRKERTSWEDEVAALQGHGKRRFRQIIPVDN